VGKLKWCRSYGRVIAREWESTHLLKQSVSLYFARPPQPQRNRQRRRLIKMPRGRHAEWGFSQGLRACVFQQPIRPHVHRSCWLRFLSITRYFETHIQMHKKLHKIRFSKLVWLQATPLTLTEIKLILLLLTSQLCSIYSVDLSKSMHSSCFQL